MTIDEAIERCTSNAEYERTHGNLQGCLEFRQLAEWLKDYKRLLEQKPTITSTVIKQMRDATPEEREAIAKYIKSISKPTGIVFDEEQEQLDFVQPHKRIPVTLTVSGDLISRETVCDYIAEFINHEYSTQSECEMVDSMIDGIQHMPPVKPQEPTGHWILQPSNKEQGERDFIWWKCSECGQVIYSETEKDRREYHAFCGRCGANMSQKPTDSKDVIWYSKRNYSEIVVEPQESEDKCKNCEYYRNPDYTRCHECEAERSE